MLAENIFIEQEYRVAQLFLVITRLKNPHTKKRPTNIKTYLSKWTATQTPSRKTL